MDFKDLSAEVQEKLKQANSQEDVRAIAEAEGLEFSDELLEGIAGGGKTVDCIGLETQEDDHHGWKTF